MRTCSPASRLGATIGFGTKADIITAFSMDLNGNAVTVSNAVWAKMKPNAAGTDGKPCSTRSRPTC